MGGGFGKVKIKRGEKMDLDVIKLNTAYPKHELRSGDQTCLSAKLTGRIREVIVIKADVQRLCNEHTRTKEKEKPCRRSSKTQISLKR